MKINLEVENKEVVFPEFDLYVDDNYPELLFIIIKNLTEKQELYIINSIKRETFKIEKIIDSVNDNLLLFKLPNIEYRFNFKKNLFFLNKKHLFFDFFDKSNIMKGINKKTIIIE